MRFVLLLLVTALAAGCVTVHPHERQRLAEPGLRDPTWPSLERADQHTFEVREGTGGATHAGGGGCGCN